MEKTALEILTILGMIATAVLVGITYLLCAIHDELKRHRDIQIETHNCIDERLHFISCRVVEALEWCYGDDGGDGDDDGEPIVEEKKASKEDRCVVIPIRPAKHAS